MAQTAPQSTPHPTDRPVPRTRRDQLRNGGQGAVIGTAFGLMWFALGRSAVHGTARTLVLAAGAVLLAASLAAVVRLFVTARRTPATRRAVPVTAPGGGPRFLRVVLIEVVVPAVGNNLLRGSLHRPELMLTWSALVVGAHFFPLARTLRAPVLRVIGAAMIATVGLAALATLLPGATPDVWQSVPGIGCAAVLWAGAAYSGLRAGRPAPAAA
ncbi:hypothetical protein ACIRP0_19565 [Streptomyces sp. NPDC101733]|uniref:hypothetical protein n=1 Tax=unclassified Streptomyces TaxID=2593676 RepID=UPI0038154495